MNKLFLSLIACTVISVAGCANTSGLQAKTSVSEFDGTKSIVIPAHGMNCKKMPVCDMIGFSWTSKAPELAGFMVEINDFRGSGSSEYFAIKSVNIKIDEEVISLTPLDKLSGSDFDYDKTTFYTTTTRGFEAPISLLNKIKNSKITKTQIITDGATFEDTFKDGDKNSKAYYAMLRFLEQIKQVD